MVIILCGLYVLIGFANTTGQVDTPTWWIFSWAKNINTAMLLIGMGMSGALFVIMWNAQTLNRQWLRVAELALKGVGMFVIVILLYSLWNQHTMRQKIEVDAIQNRMEAEAKAAQQQKDAEQRVTDLLRQMIELKLVPESRRQVIAVQRPTLRNPSLTSLALAQAVYTIALTDNDPKVRGEAWDVLFPKEPIPDDLNLDTSLRPRDFVASLLSFLRDRSTPPVDQMPYKVYVTILMRDHNSIDQKIIDEIEGFRKKARENQKQVTLAKESSSRDVDAKPVEETKNQLIGLISMQQPISLAVDNRGAQQANIDSKEGTNRGTDGAGGTHSPASVRGDEGDHRLPSVTPRPSVSETLPTHPPMELSSVLKDLADTDVATMIQALQSLSPTQRLALRPHVEVYEVTTNKTVSEPVERARKAMIAAGYIVPKAQTKNARSPANPAGVLAPTNPEVRYFKIADNPDAPKPDALRLQKLLIDLKFTNARLDAGPASKDDCKFYGEGELHKHFEVWFPSSSDGDSVTGSVPDNPPSP